MKAYLRSRYGGPEVLQLLDTEKPVPQNGQILVKIKANSVNPADWHMLRGEPYLSRLAFGLPNPKNPGIGVDFSGIVETVGDDVGRFEEGDRVFGENMQCGAFAEYMVVSAEACAKMPEDCSFTDMACAPVAGITALQGLLRYGKLQKGESVLINGSSGGVGHLAVQMARAHGARVTAVCSSGNAAFVQSLGAERVLAYDEEDLNKHKGRYDLILDVQGNLAPGTVRRLGKRAVMIGFTTMGHFFQVILSHKLRAFPFRFFTAKASVADLDQVAEMIRDGTVRMHIEKTYSHLEIPDAIRHVESQRIRGKVAIEWP